jgi:ABC-type transporter Mla subunit MlaD
MLAMAVWSPLNSPVLSAQSANAQESLEPGELEAVQKAKSPDKKLKVLLKIANERLTNITSATRKENAEELTKAVDGFRAALDRAEDLLAQESPTKPSYRKLAEPTLRATRKYSAALLETLKKAQEDLRKYIQSALEVSERISDGLALQLEKTSKK